MWKRYFQPAMFLHQILDHSEAKSIDLPSVFVIGPQTTEVKFDTAARENPKNEMNAPR